MFRIAIYNITGTGTPITQFLDGEAEVTMWTKLINAPGKMTFAVPIGSVKATAANLQKFRRVRLYRRRRDKDVFDPIWFGFIQASKMNEQTIDVECMGMLELFKKRYTDTNQLFTLGASTSAFALLATLNGASDTGITAGTGGVSTTMNLLEDRYDVLRAWEDMALATTSEFEIDDLGKFNFVSALGTDKSAVVSFVFRRDGVPGSNLAAIEYGEDGLPMVNRVIGASTNTPGYVSQKDDAASQATYGLLIERKQFDTANDHGTLDNMTQSYLTQRANPITDYRVQPNGALKTYNPITNTMVLTGLQYSDVNLGDLVEAQIVSENQNIIQVKRVVQIEGQVDKNGDEKVFYTLSKSGVFVTASYLNPAQTQDIRRRIREIDAVV